MHIFPGPEILRCGRELCLPGEIQGAGKHFRPVSLANHGAQCGCLPNSVTGDATSVYCVMCVQGAARGERRALNTPLHCGTSKLRLIEEEGQEVEKKPRPLFWR